MNSTGNASNSSFLGNPSAEKVGKTFAYCLIGIIVYKTQTLRKPINYFNFNMAMCNLLLPVFLLPLNVACLYLAISGLSVVLCSPY